MNLQMMKKYFLLFLAAPLLAACGEGNKDYDATGNFEATEVTVSAQQNGQLLYLNAEEGSMLDAGEEVGLVDTTQLWLKARQLGATRNIYATQRPDIEKQVASLRQQLDKAEQEQRRYAGLTAEGAANRKLLDDATAQVKVLRREIAAALSSLNNNTLSLNAQMSQTDIQRTYSAMRCSTTSVSATSGHLSAVLFWRNTPRAASTPLWVSRSSRWPT